MSSGVKCMTIGSARGSSESGDAMALGREFGAVVSGREL